MSDSVRPHRRQPTRLPCPWDSPAKNTGVGCHFLLQCMKVKSESEVAQSCPTLRDPMDCSLPGSSVHGIFQARVLEWGAIAFSIQIANFCYKHTFWYTQPGVSSLENGVKRILKVTILIVEKEMATHSSVLAWRMPGTGEPVGLPSMGSHKVRHNRCNLAAVAAYWLCKYQF